MFSRTSLPLGLGIATRRSGSLGPIEDPGITARSRAAKGAIDSERLAVETYTSTGVRPPWVMEQQAAPARANRE